MANLHGKETGTELDKAKIKAEECLPEVRSHMDEMIELLGEHLDHFEIGIDYTIYESASGQPQSECYHLEINVHHNLSIQEVQPYVQKHGWEALGCSYLVDSFWDGYHDSSFRMAQAVGRNLYFRLRNEYPIVRHLRWPE